MSNQLIVGLAAHVDAGKTTLSESMLFAGGTIRKPGRVDHGNAFLDTEQMEKDRGITIFSKEARLKWKKKEMILVDTPGHAALSGETERALEILDIAVLVVSATEGVQSHTKTLWKMLETYGIPVIVFVNKMDRFTGEKKELLHRIQELDDRIIDFSCEPDEQVALTDEQCLDHFLRKGSIPSRLIHSLVTERKLFPLFFGSALHNEGVTELLGFLSEQDQTDWPAEFGARVYKIARDSRGTRLAFLKVTGGTLSARSSLRTGVSDTEEKVTEIRQYSGARYVSVQRAEAGQLCCVAGLNSVMPGDGLGFEKRLAALQTSPCYTCKVLTEQDGDSHASMEALRILQEEEPLLGMEWIEEKKEIQIHFLGEVYLEVLKQQMKDRFGIEIRFGESSVIYRETISGQVEGVGHYEPLRHYAEVHLLLKPLPRGSGVRCTSAVSTDDLSLRWQRLIMTHLEEKTHRGVLTGSPITDIEIILVNGKAHLKHTEGGDFRQATYRAVRQGLMKAESILLEPWLSVEINCHGSVMGRVMNDLSLAGAKQESPAQLPEGRCLIRAVVSASEFRGYGLKFNALTKGDGQLNTALYGWLPCVDPDQVIREKAYDPLRDLPNTPDSVFCSHGAGVTVPWDEVEQYMHLPLSEEHGLCRNPSVKAAGNALPGSGFTDDEESLRIIFERTYGPVKARLLMRPTKKTEHPEDNGLQEISESSGSEILVIDGYNLLFAWDELKELASENIESARFRLTEWLCDYAGTTGKTLIVVFDAYKVRGNRGSVERYRNIYLVYTREAQTADAYIEKFTHIAREKARIRVVTSDRPEQLIAIGNEAQRFSAHEFAKTVSDAREELRRYLRDRYRAGGEKAMERLYKEAWKERAGDPGIRQENEDKTKS